MPSRTPGRGDAGSDEELYSRGLDMKNKKKSPKRDKAPPKFSPPTITNRLLSGAGAIASGVASAFSRVSLGAEKQQNPDKKTENNNAPAVATKSANKTTESTCKKSPPTDKTTNSQKTSEKSSGNGSSEGSRDTKNNISCKKSSNQENDDEDHRPPPKIGVTKPDDHHNNNNNIASTKKMAHQVPVPGCDTVLNFEAAPELKAQWQPFFQQLVRAKGLGSVLLSLKENNKLNIERKVLQSGVNIAFYEPAKRKVCVSFSPDLYADQALEAISEQLFSKTGDSQVVLTSAEMTELKRFYPSRPHPNSNTSSTAAASSQVAQQLPENKKETF